MLDANRSSPFLVNLNGPLHVGGVLLENLAVCQVPVLPEIDTIGSCGRSRLGQVSFHLGIDLRNGVVGSHFDSLRFGKLDQVGLFLGRTVQFDHLGTKVSSFWAIQFPGVRFKRARS